MDTELVKKLEEYKKELEKELKECKAERKALIAKMSNGESLSRKDNRRNLKLAARISEIEETLAKFKELHTIENLMDKINSLSPTATAKENDKNIKALIAYVKTSNKKYIDKFIENTGLTEQDVDKLAELRKSTKKEVADLENALKTNSDLGINTRKIEKEIEDKKYLLEEIEYLNSKLVNESKIKKDLETLATDPKASKKLKDKVIKTFEEISEEEKMVIAQNLAERADEDANKKKEKKDKKKETKEEKEKKDSWFKQNWKKIAQITTAVVGATALLVVLTQCSKKNNNTNTNSKPQNTKETFENSIIIEDNIITQDEQIALLERATLIQETEFLPDCSISDITEVLITMDDKSLHKSDSYQAIVDAFLPIYNNYAYETSVDTNIINRLDALKHFAKNGSDLDKFLENYVILAKNVFKTKGNQHTHEKAKSQMRHYIATFADTFVGMPTDIENPNQNAIVEAQSDWILAYHLIKPLFSAYDLDECVQINMISNYEQWAELNCDNVLTRGGN